MINPHGTPIRPDVILNHKNINLLIRRTHICVHRYSHIIGHFIIFLIKHAIDLYFIRGFIPHQVVINIHKVIIHRSPVTIRVTTYSCLHTVPLGMWNASNRIHTTTLTIFRWKVKIGTAWCVTWTMPFYSY